MKKRSPFSSNSSSTSSSSSSSSCIDSINDTTQQQQQQQTKPVRPQKCQKQDNSQTNAAKRSSIYRGVTRHRWTGRYEAHLWDKSTWNRVHNKRGRQIYLGAYDSEEAAARTYDLAALKFWGPGTILNFPIETYTKELEDMQKLSKEEYLASLRRHSSGFSRGVSKYRGVARHHHNGRWEARIGRVRGNKYLYLGTYSTQEEAAAAYDMAAIEYRGSNAVTNFDISNYVDKLKKPKPSTQIKQETPAECSEEPQHELIIKQERQEEEQESTQEASHELCDHHQDQQEGNLVVQTEVTEVPDLEFELEEESTEEASHEPYDHHQDQQEEDVVVQTGVTEVSDLEFEPSVEPHRMVVMDLEDEHEHKYPWDLCLDIGFSSLPVSDIPLDEKPTELPDTNFYDDIDLMFDAAAYENDQDAMSGNAGCKIVIKEEKGQESSTSSLSPLSTTTSVSGEV